MTKQEAEKLWQKYLEYVRTLPPGCAPAKPLRATMNALRK